MTIYHEIKGTRHYEFRQWNPGDTDWSGWHDAGPATNDTLTAIKAGFSEADEYEIRAVCSVADGAGVFCGNLIFSKVVYRQEPAHAPALS